MDRWLARVRHDLIKHAAWRARDLREALVLGRPARPSDVASLRRSLLELPDDEGQPAGLLAAWLVLRSEVEAPTSQQQAALDRFEGLVDALQQRASSSSDDPLHASALCDAILALDAAFDALAHDVKPRA